MYSRKFSNDSANDAPSAWIMELSKKMYEMVKNGDPKIPSEFGSSRMDKDFQKKIHDKCKDLIKFQSACMRACWVSAAIIRGWEVYDSLAELQPVYDDKQKQMAEEVAMYFFISRLKVFEPGVKDMLTTPTNINRF
jgi:hypothetical protein